MIMSDDNRDNSTKPNPILVLDSGWKVQQITTWPHAATLHHCGWCTSTDKGDYDEYIDSGELYTIAKRGNRNTRPHAQVHISKHGHIECRTHGNESIDAEEFIKQMPPKIYSWFNQLLSTSDDRKNYQALIEMQEYIIRTMIPKPRRHMTFSDALMLWEDQHGLMCRPEQIITTTAP